MVSKMSLVSEVRRLQKSPISNLVKNRLKEFRELGRKGNNEWFSELCFCILTANSKARTAISIQDKLGCDGFLCLDRTGLSNTIKEHKHRFHNTKAGFIVEARRFRNIKDMLKKEKDPRRWLVKNVKGLGWKESSHFLRNIGYTDYAILDRHILGLMQRDGLIAGKPKTLNENNYLETENRLRTVADRLKMSLAELDLYMWYMKTGKVLK